eukprot:gene34928-39496_t
MGSGVSVEKDALASILLSEELVDGIQVASSGTASGGSRIAACLHEYGVEHDRLISLKSSSNSDKSLMTKQSFHSSSKSTAFDGYGD